MQKLASILIIGMFAIGCGGKKKPETTTDPNTSTSNTGGGTGAAPTGDGTPCAQEIAMVCPDGQIDACLKTPQEGDVHKCVAK